ncbi:MAG: hypothetical protein MJZ61_04880 [Bacteroidales bacterium]|nr:hypothetical protein [Bacteroidales bacterium]
MNKTKYEFAEIEIVVVDNVDIVCASEATPTDAEWSDGVTIDNAIAPGEKGPKGNWD